VNQLIHDYDSQRFWWHIAFLQPHNAKQKKQKSHQANAPMQENMNRISTTEKEARTGNSSYGVTTVHRNKNEKQQGNG